MRKALICAFLLLFVAVLAGCGANRAQTLHSMEKPAVQSKEIATSPAPAAESMSSSEPASIATPKPTVQSEGLAEGTVKTLSTFVTQVVDGDTIHVRLENGKEEKVRFIGMDTPESTREVEPYRKEATAYTMKCLDSQNRLP